jgi:putative phosphoesterase
MKIAVLADIHGNILALEKVLEDIRNQGINNYIILGDIIMVGPDPAATLHLIRNLNPIAWIKGNTDMWLEEFNGIEEKPGGFKEKPYYEFYLYARKRLSSAEINFLAALPEKVSLNIGGSTILCVHGSPRSITDEMDNRITNEEMAQMMVGVKEEIVLCGHSHIPYLGIIKGKHVFNVGSVGRPLDGNISASYGLLDLHEPGKPDLLLKRVNYPVHETIRMAKESGLPYIKIYEYNLLTADFG